MSWTYTRITARTITQALVTDRDGTHRYYDLAVELNTHGLTSIGGGPAPTDFPHPPAIAPGIVQYKAGLSNLTMDAPITAGNTLIYLCGRRDATLATPGGYTIGPDGITVGPSAADKAAWFYKVAGSSESQTLTIGDLNVAGAWIELPGEWTPDTHDADTGTGATETSGPITVSANSILFTVGIMGEGGGFDAGNPLFSSTEAGWTDLLRQKVFDGHPYTWIAYQIATAAGSYQASATLNSSPWPWGMQIVSFTNPSVGAMNPPAPAQVVPWAVVTMTPDGSTSVGVTAYPYADGTLHVKVDGLLISPSSYEETDPSCGLFRLLWTPGFDENVSVTYMGR